MQRTGVAGTTIHAHRSMAIFELPSEKIINFVAIPLIFILLCIVAFPYMTDIWRRIFTLAGTWLAFPGEVKMTSLEVLPFYYLDLPSFKMNARWPSLIHLVTAGLIVAVVLIATFLFSDRLIPLAYLLRAACVIQITAIFYFALASPPFPYDLDAYTWGLLRAGIVILLLTPFLFALTVNPYNMPLVRKLFITLITMAHLSVFMPLQMLIHVYIVQHFTFMMMPVLFFMFGLILDVLIIIAFYSWGISWVDVKKQ